MDGFAPEAQRFTSVILHVHRAAQQRADLASIETVLRVSPPNPPSAPNFGRG